jgi:IrrE N-terminal-like domain
MEVMSELERARAAHPSLGDAELIERLAAEIGRELDLTPPVDIQLLASARGIGHIDAVDLAWSGCLFPDTTGLRIQVRASDPPRRQRFTCCHEVAHTLLPGFTTATKAFRCTPGDGPPDHPRNRNVEQLADLAASEFLLPRRYLTADLLDAPLGWASIQAVAERYQASLEATARRYVALAPTPTLLLSFKPNTSKTNATPALRVASRTSGGEWPFIPINKSVPTGHPIDQTQHGAVIDQVADLSCLTGTGPLWVNLSAREYAYPDSEGNQVMRVLAVATPVRPPNRTSRNG